MGIYSVLHWLSYYINSALDWGSSRGTSLSKLTKKAYEKNNTENANFGQGVPLWEQVFLIARLYANML